MGHLGSPDKIIRFLIETESSIEFIMYIQTMQINVQRRLGVRSGVSAIEISKIDEQFRRCNEKSVKLLFQLLIIDLLVTRLYFKNNRLKFF